MAIHCGGWDELTTGSCTHAWALMTGCKRQYTFMKNDKTDKFQCYGTYNTATKQFKKQHNSPKKNCGVHSRVPWPHVGGGGNSYQEFDDDVMFQRMCAWDDYNYIIGAGSKKFVEEATDIADGILDNHAYSVIDCHHNVADTGIDLIKVRNPWGTGEIQNGDFDDDGPGWKSSSQWPRTMASFM